ncbi:alkaline phosphatase D family protein, partial [Gordonia otitidis]
MSRRTFLRSASVAAGTAAVASTAVPAMATPATNAFVHSVASGDPLPDRVILWTRVTPVPQATPGSGIGAPSTLRWEVARDASFSGIVSSGTTTTSAQRDHTVKVDAGGLAPSTRYFYRFTVLDGPAAGAVSPVGRTATAPATAADIDRLRFAVCSCSNYEAGHFISYRAMADRDDIDFVLHLGDYTYEYESGGYTGAFGETVRKVEPTHATVTLADYRIRQGAYHQDPDLARAHAAHPFICMWDDHESADNSYKDGAENH